jgi:hypothetical protein
MVTFYNIGTAPPPPAAPDATVPPAHDFSTLDFAKMAETMMALVPLNEDQKKELLLSLRFKFISHEKLMKEAKNPLLEKFRDILMEGLSAKLKNFEPNSQIYRINSKPRDRYTNPVLSQVDHALGGSSQATMVTSGMGRGGAANKFQTERVIGAQASPGQQGKNNFAQRDPTGGQRTSYGMPLVQTGGPIPLMRGGDNLEPPPLPLIRSGDNLEPPPLPLIRSGDNYNTTNGLPLPPGFRESDAYGTAYKTQPGYNVFSDMEAQYNASQAANRASRVGFGDSKNPGGYSMSPGMTKSGQENYFDSHNLNTENGDDMVFTYKYDFDENGALFYLGSMGRTNTYTNPYTLSQVKVFFSSMGKGSYEDFVGRNLVNCRTLNEPNAFMGIDLGLERYIIPSCYTIRNRDSSRHIMLNWLFEGSVDFKTWFILDKRIHKTDDPEFNRIMEKERQMIERRAATSTWSIDLNYLKAASRSVVMQSKSFNGFRYFRIKQISKNSSGADNLALSGFEIYGIAKGANWHIF